MNDGQDAVTTTYTFIIAIGIVMTAVGAVYVATTDIVDSGTVQETEQINLQSEAEWLKQILLESPGVVVSGGAWDESTPSADDLTRLGLLAPDGRGLQVEKLHNLRLAPLATNPVDGYANYDEARTMLGLDDQGLGFHIRASPTLPALQRILDNPELRDGNLRVTYIGDVDGINGGGGGAGDGVDADNFACTASPTGDASWRFSVDVTNGGLSPTQFFVVMDVDGGTVLARQNQGNVVLAGATETITFDVANESGFTCDAATTADFDILDPSQLLTSVTLDSPSIGTAPPTATANFWADTDATHYQVIDSIRISYYGDMDKNDPLTLEVRQGTHPAGLLVYTDVDTVPNKAKDRYMDIPALALGDYTAYLTHGPSGVVTTQRIIVGSSEPGDYVPPTGALTHIPDPSVAIEAGYITSLVKQFCPFAYDDDTVSYTGATYVDACAFTEDQDESFRTLQPGDVFPDLKGDLRELDERLLDGAGDPRYDRTNVLVVGSNIAHNVMTDNLIEQPIEDWVLGGGTLIVFGSPDQSTQWLQSIFHVGIESSSGGISAPDVSHPLLTTPEFLDYDLYETSGKGWDYTAGAEEYFTDVVQQGGTAVTAISDPGAFGEGTIIVSSWLPFDITGDGAGANDMEGMSMVYNFILRGYGDLFIDYGPTLPDGVPVIPAVGRTWVDHPDLGPVSLDVVIFVFPE